MFGVFKEKTKKGDIAKEQSKKEGFVYTLGEGLDYPFEVHSEGLHATFSIDGCLHHTEFTRNDESYLIEGIENANLIRSIYVHPDVGWPAYTFIFEPNIIISGILFFDDETIDKWENSITNGVHICIVDPTTKKIIKFRTLGLEPDYRQILTDALKTKSKADRKRTIETYSKVSTDDLIYKGRVWIWDSEESEFEELNFDGFIDS